MNFNLFSPSPGLMEFWNGAKPIILLTQLAIWPDMLTSFLQMIRCSPMASDSPVIQHRLLPHPDVVCWGPEHEPLRHIAFCGLGIWCFGIPFALCLRIACLEGKMNSATHCRTYGYFTVGLETSYWYWDLLIQRADTALMLFVAYTSISDHESAKLLLFPIISGLMLGATAWIKPYENDQGDILDFLAVLLLTARFLLYSTVAVLLVSFPADTVFVSISSVSLLAMLISTSVYCLLHFVGQYLRSEARSLEIDKCQEACHRIWFHDKQEGVEKDRAS